MSAGQADWVRRRDELRGAAAAVARAALRLEQVAADPAGRGRVPPLTPVSWADVADGHARLGRLLKLRPAPDDDRDVS
jgi:hypothetical protein